MEVSAIFPVVVIKKKCPNRSNLRKGLFYFIYYLIIFKIRALHLGPLVDTVGRNSAAILKNIPDFRLHYRIIQCDMDMKTDILMNGL